MMGHTSPALGHTFSPPYKERKKMHDPAKWRPRQDAEKRQFLKQNQCDVRDTEGVFGPIEINGLASQAGHAPALAKENPGARAGATGAISHDVLEARFRENGYPACIDRATVMLIEAAESGDADACTMALRGLFRLPATARATIAALGLAALDDDDREHVVAATLRHAGLPMTDREAPMDGARFWAERASRTERKCYAAACFEALSPADRSAFLRRYARGVAA